MPRTLLSAVLVLAVLSAARTHAAPRSTTFVSLAVESTVPALPSAVWAQMTVGTNLVTWCPTWKAASNRKVRLARVGDVLDFTDAYGNGGKSVVTYFSKEKELRVAHEPNDASYVCRARLTLAPAGAGTRVTFVEQYSDGSAAADQAATAKKTEGEMREALAALGRNLGAK